MVRSGFLRASLVLLGVGMLGALAIVYAVGDSIAREFPEVEHLLVPVFVAIVIGTVPVLAGIITVWQLAQLATVPSAAFSTRTLGLLRRLRLLVLVTCAYLAIGFLGTWALAGNMSPGVLLLWIALESMGIFAISLVSLLEQLFRRGVEFRVDSELTV
jgi:hypothetical protein